ncbi:MAG TPA: hypothetical protein VFY48_00710 [Solirubrobacterales bacterium]|nr:hypothetical protein [Solirubrobacterales bacterium]
MTRLAPSWLLNAQALDAGEDPHLPSGVHLRVLPGFGLGLPVAPLLVWRSEINSDSGFEHPDVVWTDAAGNLLRPPIAVAETGPVTAWLPTRPGNPVVYARVFMSAGEGARVDGFVSGRLGPTAVAGTDRHPWGLGATGLDRLVVSGDALIEGITVLRAAAIDPRPEGEPLLLSLPVADAFRYRGVEDAWGEAMRRVERGAPLRVGLHDDFESSDPWSCREAGAGEEEERVKALWGAQLEELVTALLAEGPISQQRLRMPPRALSGPAADSSVVVPPLASVLQAALDPGVGRLLGFLERDESPPAGPEGLVAYLVRGAFMLRRAPLGRRFSWLGPALVEPPGEFPLDLPPSVWEPGQGQFADLWTVAVGSVGAGAPPPQPPRIEASEERGWVPESSPARRHVGLRLGGLGPGAGIALARRAPDSAGLNPRLSETLEGAPDRALPIVCGVLAELPTAAAAAAPGQGEVFDRTAPAEEVAYTVAQSDWFGRWSEWAEVTAAPGVRPAVPMPVLEAAFVPPAAAGDPGRLEVRCVQVRDDKLAPGGLPLERLELTAQVGDALTVTADVEAERGPTPAGDPEPLLAVFEVPPLAPAEQRALSATGVWHDSEGRESRRSPAARATAADPRAPAALVLPNTLDYASRPDGLGRARVRLTWTGAAPPLAYRVYRSGESTLLAHLRRPGVPGAAVLQQLEQIEAAPDRAEVFRDKADLFDSSCFELLTATPLPTSGGPMSRDDEVSGSLGGLVFYRVVPVSELGAEAPFTDCSLLVFGIPNTPAPPLPLLSATADPDDSTRVRLAVTVPEGANDPVRARLRRSRAGGEDPLRMPVVATVDVVGRRAELLDAGPAPWAQSLRLAPWSTYTWRAEVQGPPEPGSGLPGAWSAPSAPASVRVLPNGPPQALRPGTAVLAGAEVEVAFSAAEPLDAGPDEAYSIDLYRQVPAGAAVASGAVGSFAPAAVRQPDGTYLVRDPAAPPPGTVYLGEVADPLDRRGPRVAIATL